LPLLITFHRQLKDTTTKLTESKQALLFLERETQQKERERKEEESRKIWKIEQVTVIWLANQSERDWLIHVRLKSKTELRSAMQEAVKNLVEKETIWTVERETTRKVRAEIIARLTKLMLSIQQ